MPMRLLFLRGNGYLFDSGKGTYWTDHLDKFIANLLKGSTSEPKIDSLMQISIINSAAFLYYRDNLGKYCIRHNLWTAYPQLAKWIEANGAQVGVQRDGYNVSLGLDGQFLALSDRGHQWNAISREFHRHIQKMLTDDGTWKEDWEPSGALFGVHNSYVITCKGGRHVAFSTNLRQHYPGLEQRFQERFHPKNGVGPKYDYITLNPYAANEWVVVWADDTVSWSLSPSIIEILGPVTTWLSSKADIYTAPSSTASSTASTTPQPPPLHHAHTTPAAAKINETASFKPNPPSRPVSTASASAYHPSYGTTAPQPHQYHPHPAASSIPFRPHLPAPSHSTPAPSRPTMWTHPNDTSTADMLKFLNTFGKQMNQFSNNNSSAFGSFGGGGDPTGGMLSGGGDPTGGMLTGGDPTGGLMSGGLMAGGDPTGGMLTGGMGMDPGSLMMQSQCCVM